MNLCRFPIGSSLLARLIQISEMFFLASRTNAASKISRGVLLNERLHG